jgi:hypothetical protein
MKKLAPVILLLFVLTVSSCGQKELIGPNAENFTRSDSYQPVTAGSTWKYNVNASGFTDVKTVIMKANTAVFDGRTYAVAQATQKSDGTTENEYYYHSGSIYTTRADASAPDDVVEAQYLDDSAIIGTTFISKPNALGTNGGNPVRWVGTIVDRNATRTVGGLSFKNVIHTKVDLQYDYGSGFISSVVYDYYVSRGVGIIELNASSSGVVFATQQITNYNIR